MSFFFVPSLSALCTLLICPCLPAVSAQCFTFSVWHPSEFCVTDVSLGCPLPREVSFTEIRSYANDALKGATSDISQLGGVGAGEGSGPVGEFCLLQCATEQPRPSNVGFGRRLAWEKGQMHFVAPDLS